MVPFGRGGNPNSPRAKLTEFARSTLESTSVPYRSNTTSRIFFPMTSLSPGRKRISAFSYCNGKTTLAGTGESGKPRPFPAVNLPAGIKVDSGAGFRRQWEVAAFLGRGFLEDFWKRIRENAMSGEGIGAEDALAVLALPREDLWRLLDVTDGVRRRFKGDAVRLCSIVNAKSGLCSEDCSFCSQSRRSKADIRKYPLIEEEEMVRAAREAKARGAREFSIVSSGLAMRNRGELERVGNAIERIRSEVGIETCVSLGTLSAEDVSYLLSRGLRSLHHNLETSRSFFPSVCTTHDYEEDVRAVREAKAAGAMAGNYLTTAGRPAEDDIRMIRDLGLAVLPA